MVATVSKAKVHNDEEDMATLGMNRDAASNTGRSPSSTSAPAPTLMGGVGSSNGSNGATLAWNGAARGTAINTTATLTSVPRSKDERTSMSTKDASRWRAGQNGAGAAPKLTSLAANNGENGAGGRGARIVEGLGNGQGRRQGYSSGGSQRMVVDGEQAAADARGANVVGDEVHRRSQALSGISRPAPEKRPASSATDFVAETPPSGLEDARFGGNRVAQQHHVRIVPTWPAPRLHTVRKNAPSAESAAAFKGIPKQAAGLSTRENPSTKPVPSEPLCGDMSPTTKLPTEGHQQPSIISSRAPVAPCLPRETFAPSGGDSVLAARAAHAAPQVVPVADGCAAASISPAIVTPLPDPATETVVRPAVALSAGDHSIVPSAPSNLQETTTAPKRRQPPSTDEDKLQTRAPAPLPPPRRSNSSTTKKMSYLPSSPASSKRPRDDDETSSSSRAVVASPPHKKMATDASSQKSAKAPSRSPAAATVVGEALPSIVASASALATATVSFPFPTPSSQSRVRSPSPEVPPGRLPSPKRPTASATSPPPPRVAIIPSPEQNQRQQQSEAVRSAAPREKDETCGSVDKKKAVIGEGPAIRPVAALMGEPALEIPEVSEADVGKMVLSETSAGTLTGVVESFLESDGLGVWSIRYENGRLQAMDDCGELHDDMCAYFEYAGNAAAAAGKQVRTRGNPSVQEQVRARLFEDGGSVIGRRVCKVVGKTLHEGQVTKYIQPTRDGEIDRWRVTYDDGETVDCESFELVRPLLRYVERRTEQRDVQWGFRRLSAYLFRTGEGSARPFATLVGISASMPSAA